MSARSGVLEAGPKREVTLGGWSIILENSGPMAWHLDDQGRVVFRSLGQAPYLIWSSEEVDAVFNRTGDYHV